MTESQVSTSDQKRRWRQNGRAVWQFNPTVLSASTTVARPPKSFKLKCVADDFSLNRIMARQNFLIEFVSNCYGPSAKCFELRPATCFYYCRRAHRLLHVEQCRSAVSSFACIGAFVTITLSSRTQRNQCRFTFGFFRWFSRSRTGRHTAKRRPEVTRSIRDRVARKRFCFLECPRRLS